MILKPPKGAMLNRGHPLARGLKGCWLMNEGGGTIVNDLSGNGNTGILSGTAPTWIAGSEGPAIDFPGTNEIITLTNTISLVYPWSISWRHKADATSIFLGYYNGSANNWLRNDSATSLNLRTTSGASRAVAIPNIVTSGWTTWTVVTDVLSQAAVYRNGVYVGRMTTIGDLGILVNCVGAGFTSLLYNGQWSWTMIHKGRALSATDIMNLYRSPFAMFEVDL